jgi:hypothetical protein
MQCTYPSDVKQILTIYLHKANSMRSIPTIYKNNNIKNTIAPPPQKTTHDYEEMPKDSNDKTKTYHRLQCPKLTPLKRISLV